jgi:hypothetical protein
MLSCRYVDMARRTHTLDAPDGRPATGASDPIQPDPLADPAITAIFDDVAHAGEATLGLANAELADAGASQPRRYRG